VVQPVRQHFDFSDYVELEDVSTVKHEFLNGMVWAMAGGSPDHARIAANVSGIFRSQLAGKRCSVHSSDLRVRVKATGLGTYPDVTIICDHLELDPDDPKGHTVLNPRVVVEVLSPSTADYDRGEKLDHYRQIPSLEAIVLVAHDARRIDVLRRDGQSWVAESAAGAGNVAVEAIGCRLAIEEVYFDPLA
jgi:Uma2 family endonuclease